MKSIVESRRFARAIVWCAAGALSLPSGVRGQDALDGTWRGDLPTPAGALTLVVSIEGATGTVGVPSRGVSGIPVTEVTLLADGSLTFQVPADRAAFEGRLETETEFAGEWIQAGQRIPIEFTRVADIDELPPELVRSQTPQPPFPYVVEDIAVDGGERLACTVTRPREATRVGPGAVLLTVAGANDRDQTHSGHKPYMVLADHLTRNGMAVLRCDDRGVGGSAGELTSSSMVDLVEDALAMVRVLGAMDGVGPVGVIGNSEGSVVGSLAAATAPGDVAFVVLLGGVGVSGSEVIRERIRRQATDGGRTDEQAEAALAPFDALTVAVLDAGGHGVDELKRTDPDAYERLLEIARTAGARDPFLPPDLDDRVALFAGSWYYAQLALDGGEILERVRAPVLALTGSKDRSNLPEQNLPAIRAALERAGNADFEVTEVPDLNHVFQTARVGGMAEYGRLDESFAPIALDLITEWIVSRFGTDDEAK